MLTSRILSLPVRISACIARRQLGILHKSTYKVMNMHYPGQFKAGPLQSIHIRTLWQLKLTPNSEEDGVTEDDELVYLDWNRRELVWGSMFVSFGVTACVIKASVDVFNAKIHLAGSPTLPIVIGMCIPSMWLLITFLQNRMFMWMYYNEEEQKFTAVGIDRRLGKNRLEFTPSDVKSLTGGFWKTIGGNYQIKGKPYFITDAAFLKQEFCDIFRSRDH